MSAFAPGVQEGTADAAAAVPAGVAASIQAFVASLTTPETELEQQARDGEWVAVLHMLLVACPLPCLPCA